MYEKPNEGRRVLAEQGKKLLAGVEMMTKNPMEIQKKLLLELMKENKDTEYGKTTGPFSFLIRCSMNLFRVMRKRAQVR